MNTNRIDEGQKPLDSGGAGSSLLQHDPPFPLLEAPDSTKQATQPNAESVSNLQDDAAQRLDRLESTIRQVLAHLEQLSMDFDAKIKYDAQKNESIALLHRELQEHKDDLLAKVTRPLINDVIALYDDIEKTSAHYRESLTDLGQEDFMKSLVFFKQYVIDILEKHEVFQCQSPSDDFDPKTQQVLEVITTDEADQSKKIGKRLRVGFKHLDRMIRPEGVAVFRFSPTSQTQNNDDLKTTKP